MKGVLIFTLTLFVIVRISFYFFEKYSIAPNLQTQLAAQSIPKFPSASNWQIKSSKNICFPDFGSCSQPINIIFNSQENWANVYSFYIGQRPTAGWKTNSKVVTSTPTSIVFASEIGCTAELSSYDPITNVVKKPESKQFKFAVVCP